MYLQYTVHIPTCHLGKRRDGIQMTFFANFPLIELILLLQMSCTKAHRLVGRSVVQRTNRVANDRASLHNNANHRFDSFTYYLVGSPVSNDGASAVRARASDGCSSSRKDVTVVVADGRWFFTLSIISDQFGIEINGIADFFLWFNNFLWSVCFVWKWMIWKLIC